MFNNFGVVLKFFVETKLPDFGKFIPAMRLSFPNSSTHFLNSRHKLGFFLVTERYKKLLVDWQMLHETRGMIIFEKCLATYFFR